MSEERLVKALKKVVGMAPMNVFETNFNFKVKEVNLSVYKKLSKKTNKKLITELSEGINLWQFPSEIALLDDNKKQILYYVQFKKQNVLSVPSITQIKLWRSPLIRYSISDGFSVTSYVFWKVLLPMATMLVSDGLQTYAGRRFWEDQIAYAFKKGYHIYVIDQNRKTKKELFFDEWENSKDYYWGDDEKFQAIKIGISE